MQGKSKHWQTYAIVLLSLNPACSIALAHHQATPAVIAQISSSAPQASSTAMQHCDKALQRALDDASVILRNNSLICEAEHTHWLGRTVNQSKKWLPELLGYPAQDCRSQNQREYSSATGLAELLHQSRVRQP